MNTRKKRLLSHLLILCMVLSLMPAMSMTAYAATTYPVWISGVQLTSDNVGAGGTVTGISGITAGTVTYTPKDGTTPAVLSLSGATITSGVSVKAHDYAAIYAEENLTLTLAGDNNVTDYRVNVTDSDELRGHANGIKCGNGNMTVKEAVSGSEASLDVSCTSFFAGIGIADTASMTLESGTIIVSATQYGIYKGSLTVSGGNLKISTTNNPVFGICSVSPFNITGGTVEATGTYCAYFNSIPTTNAYPNAAVKAGDTKEAAETADYVTSPTDATYQSKYVWIGPGAPPVTRYPVWVGGEQVTSENLSGTGWTYTPADGETAAILALNNANLTSGVSTAYQNFAAIYTTADLTLTLAGENTVTGTGNSEYAAGISNDAGTLTIREAAPGATLNISCAAAHGIWANGSADIKLESGAVSVTAGGGRGCVYAGIYINGGEITCIASDERTSAFLIPPVITGYADVGVKAGTTKDAADEAGLVEDLGEDTYTDNKYVWIGKGVTTYPVWLGGVKVTENNMSNVLGDGTVSYTPAEGTKGQQGYVPAILALNNATITSGVSTNDQRHAAIYTEADLTLTLAGTNTVTEARDDGGSVSGISTIFCTGDAPHLTIKEATAGNSATLHVNGASFDYGIFFEGTAKMTLESGAVTVSGKQYGVFMQWEESLMTVNGGSLNASGTGTSGHGIHTYLVDFTINGGTVIASGGTLAIYEPPELSGYDNVAVKAGDNANSAVSIDTPDNATYYNKYVWIGSGSVTPPPSTGGGGSYIPSPTIKITDDEDNQSGGSAKYDLIKNNVVITPAEGFKIKNVLLNGKSMGPVTELENVYGWQTVEVIFEKKETEVLGPTTSKQELIKKLKSINLKAKSKLSTLRGKTAVRLVWTVENAEGLDFDGFVIFRSTDTRFSGYGTEPIFTTENMHYYNTKDLEPGHTYYYKVQGYVIKNNEKILTPWSTKAWRTI